jgi:hypothetical protein
LNTALLRTIAYSAYVKQKVGIRSEEMSKSILTYLVPKPFDQIGPLTDSNEAIVWRFLLVKLAQSGQI